MQDTDFIMRGVKVFAEHVLFGAIGYLVAVWGARWILSNPWKIYFLRLLLMLLVVLAWWCLYVPMHVAYNGTPGTEPITMGNRYGYNTIWIWVALTLVAIPRKRKHESSAA